MSTAGKLVLILHLSLSLVYVFSVLLVLPSSCSIRSFRRRTRPIFYRPVCCVEKRNEFISFAISLNRFVFTSQFMGNILFYSLVFFLSYPQKHPHHMDGNTLALSDQIRLCRTRALCSSSPKTLPQG